MKHSKPRFNLGSYLKKAFAKGTTINDYNLDALVIVGTFGHPIFAALHLYLFKMPWDNLILKSSAGLVCLLLATKKYWPKWLKPIFPFYWHFMLIYNLSFLITLTALNNHFIKTWFMWEVIMLYILTMFVPQLLIFLIDLMIGVVSALVVYSFFFSGAGVFDPILVFQDVPFLEVLLYVSTFIFVIISGFVFSYSNAKGVASEERAKIFKSLAGSIAHELRNPLNAINLVGSQISDLASDLDAKNKNALHSADVETIPNAKSKLLSLTSDISDSIANANNIINIILGDLSEKKINPEDFLYLKSERILPEILDKYSYNDSDEREKVKFLAPKDEADNFIFKAVTDRLSYVIFNLVKNALYYSNQYPHSTVTVSTEKRKVGRAKYNVVYVKDTGPGISPEVIPNLFNDFYTVGKKEGTGLGLSFCKRNMQMFGGDIICESEFGKWTKFSLLFPKVPKEEIRKAELKNRKRKILLVDDKEVNLITTKSKLENIFPYISCEIAKTGKAAIKMAKKNKYELILMDIEIPDINGIEATKQIRLHDKEVPIIALTSLKKDSLLKAIDDMMLKNEFNYYLSKSLKGNLLYRSVGKWITSSQDELPYLGKREDYLAMLNARKIILADDQRINRLVVKRGLEASGLVVTEANDGKELVEIYQNSLNANGESYFDAIVTDINMPPYNGDDAAKKIREIEVAHRISHHDEIPIIALSGDGSREDIHHFFECQITDYFIKGSKPELLLKIIANYLIKKDVKPVDAMHEAHLHGEVFDLNRRVLDEHLNREDREVVLKMFVKDTDELMVKIAASSESGNIKDLLLHTHSIRGIAANVGADKLYDYTKKIEFKIKNNEMPQGWLEEMTAIYDDLKGEIGEVIG